MAPIHSPLTEKISLQVASRLPDFVNTNHPEFIVFMEKYYEFLEQQGEAYEVIGNLLQYKDIDKTIVGVQRFFNTQFAIDIPDTVLVDKEFLIKNIRSFYRTRGSEESLQYLFRILFDDEVSFRYPSLEILRTSDGKWTRPIFIQTSDFQDVYRTIQGRLLTGNTTGATAVIDLVIKVGTGQTQFQLVHVFGTFDAGETATATDIDGNPVVITLDSMIDKINITNEGNSYVIDDLVVFDPPTTGSSSIQARVNALTTGTVTSLTINAGGSGYSSGEYLTVDSTNILTDNESHPLIAKIFRVAQEVITIDVTNQGAGYIIPPLVTFTGGTPTTVAVAESVINNVGNVVAVKIITNGEGYNSAPTIGFTPQAGETPTIVATATATVSGGATAGEIQQLYIENPGKGYSGIPTISDPIGTAGSGLSITVNTNGVNGIKSVNILNHGTGVSVIPNPSLAFDGDGTATATATIAGMVIDEIGLWTNTDGFLSSDKVLQDNLFFQDYSYVIKTGISFSTWEDVVSRITHPAGTKMFGQVSTETSIGVTVISVPVTTTDTEINYILTPPGETMETVDLSVNVIPILTLYLRAELNSDTEVGLGATNRSFEKYKFFTEGGGSGIDSSRTIQYHSNDTVRKYIDTPANRINDGLDTYIEVLDSFEDFETTSSPNVTFWNTTATGTRGTEQTVVDAQTFKFSGAELLQTNTVTALSKTKIGMWYYSSSTGTDIDNDTTNIITIIENTGLKGATVTIRNTSGSKYLGANSDAVTTDDFEITEDTWYYIELIVDSSTYEFKINEQSIKTGTISVAPTAIDRRIVGHSGGDAANFISYIDNLRVVSNF